jgi:hypothetical protein
MKYLVGVGGAVVGLLIIFGIPIVAGVCVFALTARYPMEWSDPMDYGLAWLLGAASIALFGIAVVTIGSFASGALDVWKERKG